MAWHSANFGRAGKGFKDLGHYLNQFEESVNPVSAADKAAAIFKGLAAQGKAKIKERKRDGG